MSLFTLFGGTVSFVPRKFQEEYDNSIDRNRLYHAFCLVDIVLIFVDMDGRLDWICDPRDGYRTFGGDSGRPDKLLTDESATALSSFLKSVGCEGRRRRAVMEL